MTVRDNALRSASDFSGSWLPRLWILAAMFAVGVGLVIAADFFVSQDHARSAEQWTLRKPEFGPSSYAAALAAAETQLAAKQALASEFPKEWPRSEALASAHLDRFRLTGDYDDLAQANAHIARGRALAVDPAGPVLADAAIGMAGHRLVHAESALARLERWAIAPERAERAEAAALAGDIAFYRGDIGQARRRYAEAAAIDPGSATLRLALADKAQGRHDAAIAGLRFYLNRARNPSPQTVASIAMQIGAIELARGNAVEARRRFGEANAVFPGFWLIEAHLAQADAIAGHPARAIERMRDVAIRSQGAETMDALAMLLRTFGDPAESRAWAQRAGAIWSRRLALAPEAAYGHAIEHELVFGDPARALGLARRNLAARPYGEARLLLANALILNGRIDEALGQLDRAEASGWRSAPLYALRAQAMALSGREADAEAARRAATALNPRIFAPETSLVWFSHG